MENSNHDNIYVISCIGIKNIQNLRYKCGAFYLPSLYQLESDFFEKLIIDGQALMPLDDYGFSKKFGWLNDRFGVSWQLNLPK